MMAQSVTYDEITVVSHYKQGTNWGPNSNFNFTTTDGKIYTCVLKDVTAENVWFRIVKNKSDMQWGPNSSKEDLVLTSSYQQAYESKTHEKSFKIENAQGSTYTITWDNETNQIMCVKEGSSSGSGTGNPTVEWDTENTNRLKGRVYSQGFYLAGNFFSFQPKEGDNQDNLITYDDAVFKFQQQKYDDEDYDLYKVDIPASLNARAQVMSVNEFGKPVMVYGPNSKFGISYACPNTGETTLQLELKGSDKFEDGGNYWDMVSRNHSSTEYSDGMYEVYITVNKKTGVPAKWWFKHIATKRVAFFISDAPNGTAMPLYDTYKKNTTQFGDKFFASVNLAAERSYYVISNYVMRKDEDYIKPTRPLYGTLAPDGNRVNCPTTNKLFLLGNGGFCVETADEHNNFSPNEKPMKPSDNQLGTLVVEYNCSNGICDNKDAGKYLGFRGQVIIHEEMRTKLTSVSLVGDAIPGTVKDGTWDYKSNAADMTYDETEQCYKATVVTTVSDNGLSKFRFVGNRDPKITWFENTKDDEKEMAKHPHDSKSAPGHTADANDPNQVNYTQDGVNPEKDWNIIWNRPAGRWTVRLYFVTYSDGNDAKTDYYYTITANRDMELHDVKDVVYGSSDNKQIITNLDGYKFMRTWSAKKAWKISDKVDIFVVSGFTDVESGVKMILTKINGDKTGADNVIPANTGVILATKYDASAIPGAQFKSRQNFTSYNNLVIPMEQYDTDVTYDGTNFLETILVSRVVPSSEDNKYNYLFGYYNTQIATGDKIHHEANEYLLGFWISKGSKPYSSNSSYLQIDKETAAKMKYLGTSYKDYVTGGGSAKKIPAFLFDFANVGGTTGINEVVNQSTKLNDGKYYTLSGQQVEKPTAGGIYIHNGRKFVVK